MLPPLHPCCEVWDLDTELVDKIAESIAKDGQQAPITLTKDGQMLDGRHRWLACEKVGVEPKTQVYDGDDPAGYVAIHNVHRRHLPKHVLLAKVTKLVSMQNGGDRRSKDFSLGNPKLKTAIDIGEQFGVRSDTISCRRTIEKHGESNVIALVDSGKLSTDAAVHYVRHTSREEQRTATAAEIRRRGNLLKKGMLPKKSKKAATPKPPRHEWPVAKMTDIDLGDRSQLNPKRQVHLHPANVEKLRQDEIFLAQLSGKVTGATSSYAFDMQYVEKAIDHLLSYQPIKGKKNGEQVDYAANARQLLDGMASRIDTAIANFTALRELMNKYQHKLNSHFSQPSATHTFAG
jgi:hypothetical protein